MNYETQIDRAFAELRLSPRPGQREAVSRVLTEFFDNHKTNVVLSADTGTGKSIIAAAVAKCFGYLKPETLNSFILMQNNALVNQYAETFDHFEDTQFHQIKGASNYPCSALAELTNDVTADAESCAFSTLPDPMKLKFCSSCEYKRSKGLRNETKNLITNYSYYFVSKMWADILDERPLTVFDEAHTLNEVFCDHNAIYFSVERLHDYAKELTDKVGPLLQDQIKVFRDLAAELKYGRITESNYLDRVRKLIGAYKEVYEVLIEQAEAESLENAVKTKKLAKKYFNLGCKIGDLLVYKYDHIFEYIEDDQAVSIKPIFMGKMSDRILGPRNLFMSATISDKYIIETLELDPDTVGFVKLPPVFDPENKTIVFVGNQSLNYQAMNTPEVIATLAEKASKIVSAHAGMGEKGLILTPSFKVAEQIANGMTDRKATVFLHTRRDNINDLIEAFKKSTKPAVLISPSIFEGLDFAGDASRYQILVKAPFPSLGEKRMQYIANNYGDIYRLMTLKKIIQGIGRSVRSEDDYATTYVLDSNIKKLFDSPLNVWKDQFEVERA